MTVHDLFRLVKHTDLIFQFVANLYTKIPLASNAFSQPVQIFVLSPQHLGVILVYLLVIQMTLIGRSFPLRLVPVWKQSGSIRLFLRIWRCVREPDGFIWPGGVGRGAFEEGGRRGIPRSDFLGGGEVGREGGVIGLGDGWLGGGGEAAELGGQVVELLTEVGGTCGRQRHVMLLYSHTALSGRTSHHSLLLAPMPRRPRASDPRIWKCVHLGNWARGLGRWPAAVRATIALCDQRVSTVVMDSPW